MLLWEILRILYYLDEILLEKLRNHWKECDNNIEDYRPHFGMCVKELLDFIQENS